jgi:hypothetical protein
MYLNAKMILIETFRGMAGGKIKHSSGGGESKYDIFDTV